ncbi:translation elongation factor Ts [Thioalkalivibrio sp. HK1]|uniref:translation elongation factor Ts n=1 Tax=Thioalkalivibrio sp. HK1 TaxID=1469245 RepID=UPI00046EF8CB|nr:translation elongation factor Ts [Thioalkalivibrio sp. HK1]
MQISAAMVKDLRERTGAGMMDCKKALEEAGGDREKAVEIMRLSGQAKADRKADRVAAEGVIAIRVDEDAGRAVMVEVNCETDFVAKEQAFRDFADAVCLRIFEESPQDVEALGNLSSEKGGDGPAIDEVRRELIARIGENIGIRRFEIVDSKGGRLSSYLHGVRIGVIVDVDGGDSACARDIAMHVAASRPIAIDEKGIPADLLEGERRIIEAQIEDSGKPAEIRQKMLEGRMRKYLQEVTLLGQPFVKDSDQSIERYLKDAGASVIRFERFEVGEGIEKKSDNFAEEVMSQVRSNS